MGTGFIGDRLPYRPVANAGGEINGLVEHAMGQLTKIFPIVRVEGRLF
jgi:hypothetical protein